MEKTKHQSGDLRTAPCTSSRTSFPTPQLTGSSEGSTLAFLNEVRSQKKAIEVCHERMKVLKSIIKRRKHLSTNLVIVIGGLAVEFLKEKFIEEIMGYKRRKVKAFNII